MPLDSIKLANMGFYAHHGTTPAEREVGQRFFLDLEMRLDLKRAGTSDRLEDTVDYQKVYCLIEEVTCKKEYKLLEALIQDIADALLETFNMIDEVEISIRKPQVPLKGILDYAEVTIRRGR